MAKWVHLENVNPRFSGGGSAGRRVRLEGRVELTRFTSNAGKHMIDPHTGHAVPAKPSLSIALLPPVALPLG